VVAAGRCTGEAGGGLVEHGGPITNGGGCYLNRCLP
jgi:hypothetical protein